jgi:hypothetical protein
VDGGFGAGLEETSWDEFHEGRIGLFSRLG